MTRAAQLAIGPKKSQPGSGSMPRGDILTRDDVADWLKVWPRQVERLGVPCIDLGTKTKRYFRADVLEWLQEQRKP